MWVYDVIWQEYGESRVCSKKETRERLHIYVWEITYMSCNIVIMLNNIDI